MTDKGWGKVDWMFAALSLVEQYKNLSGISCKFWQFFAHKSYFLYSLIIIC